MNYCPKCGTKLIDSIIDDTQVKKCLNCNYIDWNNYVNIACITVAENSKKEVLMVKLKGKEEGKITFPGGFRDLGESLEEAAKREFYEETGMIIDEVTLYKVYTKDEIRLVWIVFKTKIEEINFIENNETKEAFFVKDLTSVNKQDIRGNLTMSLLKDLFND